MKQIIFISLLIIFSSCNGQYSPKHTCSNEKKKEFQKLIKQGQSYLEKMMLDSAYITFQKVIESNPDTVVGYYGIGVVNAIICHQTGQKCYEAIEFMKKTLVLEPDYKKANYNIGTCYTSLENYALSIEYFNRAIAQDKNNGIYYFNRGFSKLKLNKIKEACEDFNIALDLGAYKAQEYLIHCK